MSDLELVEEPPEPEREEEEASEPVDFLHGPPPIQKSWSPLRTFDPHEAPTGWGEVLHRGLRHGVLNPILLVYAPLASVPLFAQRVPWVNHPLPWPGQALSTFVLCFCLLERARAAKAAEREMDVLDAASLLWRVLVFLFPLALGVGTLPPSAYAVIPVLLLLFPLLLGAMASDVWGEFHPRALWAAFWETPNYLATAVLSGLALAGATWGVWAFPDGQAFLRGSLGVLGFALAGAIIGAARRDAELLGDAQSYYTD
ncbi:MAG: hypothetical protein AB7N76_07400 [Planctomycetota bacterium]